MNKAFTLVELLVVVGIMGLLGTISVGGYRAMQRGMEERGVMENVNTLVRSAFERAQIDRQPTAIYYWNETLRQEDTEGLETEVVVGRAVAVRRQGRLSLVAGDKLVDEYADLDQVYRSSAESDSSSSSGTDVNRMYLYCFDKVNESEGRLDRSEVSSVVEKYTFTERFMNGRPSDSVGSGETETWAFRVLEKNNAQWQVGSAYGVEFAEITLPHNYIFGTDYSKSVSDPVKGEGYMCFLVGRNTGNGVQSGASLVKGNLTVYALRPGQSGNLETKRVAQNDQPY